MLCTSYRAGYSLPWMAGASGRNQVLVGIKHASRHFLLRSNHGGADRKSGSRVVLCVRWCTALLSPPTLPSPSQHSSSCSDLQPYRRWLYHTTVSTTNPEGGGMWPRIPQMALGGGGGRGAHCVGNILRGQHWLRSPEMTTLSRVPNSVA